MRTACTVERYECSRFSVSGDRPYRLDSPAYIRIWLTRTYSDRREAKGLLEILLGAGFMTDGASTFWPVSKLVPPWRVNDSRYNAGPVAHDVLYILEGHIVSSEQVMNLSREEVDDILRGIWRCWGMSRFLAGAADKAVEVFAGGDEHWGSDSYGVRDLVSVYWHPMTEAA